MALRIRNNKDIKGFQITIDEQTHSIKISQLEINVHSSESNAFLKSTKTIAPSTL
jgi:hypothetical protein